jgi:AraC-like DNA-binding protein
MDHEIAVLWTVFATLAGHPPRVLECGLGFPIDDLRPYAELLGTLDLVPSDQTWIRIVTSDMDRPLPQSDPDASERRRAVVGVSGLVFERLSRARGGPPPLATVARDLHTSARTLRRQLAIESTSFRGIREDVCRQRAEELLRGGTLTIEAIAIQIGYATASAFTHAFRRWFGVSPTAFRDRNRHHVGSTFGSFHSPRFAQFDCGHRAARFECARFALLHGRNLAEVGTGRKSAIDHPGSNRSSWACAFVKGAVGSSADCPQQS